MLPLTLAIDGTDWASQFDTWRAADWAVLALTASVVCIGANWCIQHATWRVGAPVLSMFYVSGRRALNRGDTWGACRGGWCQQREAATHGTMPLPAHRAPVDAPAPQLSLGPDVHRACAWWLPSWRAS